jgi:flagellar motor protein MotB
LAENPNNGNAAAQLAADAETTPLVPNTSEENRRKNRRVELIM